MSRVTWISVRGYAERYSLDLRTVRKWFALGYLQGFRCGRVIRVRNRPPDPDQTTQSTRSSAASPTRR